jgi:mRNA-degrading endonuclease RelE of RelBE toxin-antitoxin system
MSEYELVARPGARRTLSGDGPPDALRGVLHEVAGHREPTDHPKTTTLRNSQLPSGLLRVRVGDWRAVCRLDKPRLEVICVAHRDGVYDRARERLEGGTR